MFKKIMALALLTIISVSIFTACVDYGYEFHFSVIGENGNILPDPLEVMSKSKLCVEVPWCRFSCSDSSHIITLLGGRKGEHELTFIAIPDEGYQVKEWLFNGEIIEGNKSDSFIAKVSYIENYCGVISVEFELIN